MSAPTLDYRPRLDERNRAYRLQSTLDLSEQARYWTPGAVLNQQAEGACVGFGVTGEALASPARRRFADGPDAAARSVYRRCLQIDEFEGERDEGTSVRAGMLVGRERGWWSGFQWAFNMAELRTALETGPVVIGVDWYSSMYNARNAEVTVTGSVVGGHCLLLTGYSPDWNGWGPHYRWRNSWGPSYGANGSAYISTRNLQRILFASGGEAASAVGRTT